jgi:putative heme-binding domain-containing protein
LNRAETFNGASSYFKAIEDIRIEAAASLTPSEVQQLDAVIHPKQDVKVVAGALAGQTVKEWKLEDLTPLLDRVSRGRSYEKARATLVASACVACHRVSNDRTLPAGVVGPDLTAVSSRFNRRDLLDNILNPSKVIDDKYKNVVVLLSDGTRAAGSVESEDDVKLVLKPNPLSPEKIEVPKNLIKNRKLSDVSPMPAGLLNALTADQILDILAYFEAGGDPKYKAFQPAP